jgi:hypothetical protein
MMEQFPNLVKTAQLILDAVQIHRYLDRWNRDVDYLPVHPGRDYLAPGQQINLGGFRVCCMQLDGARVCFAAP